jgi:hypothetical protein
VMWSRRSSEVALALAGGLRGILHEVTIDDGGRALDRLVMMKWWLMTCKWVKRSAGDDDESEKVGSA